MIPRSLPNSLPLPRRHFLQRAAAFSLGFVGLRTGLALAKEGAAASQPTGNAFGPLLPDPARILDLPRGFSYVPFSRFGEPMSDGLIVPGKHDGMAAFPGQSGGEDGLTVLIRNQEIEQPAHGPIGPFGPNQERRAGFPAAAQYDTGPLAIGGTTTVLFDTRSRKVVREFLSLAGTVRNCAGGPTPWNSWLSCEEAVDLATADGGLKRDHGYVFEVPASAREPILNPMPIKGLGRFNHEAVAIDPATGIVYLTEDRSDGLIYRFIPKTPTRLLDGGRLQALALKNRPRADLRNWENMQHIPVGVPLDAAWIDLDDVDPRDDDLRYRGFAAGAARFARGEGMWFAGGGGSGGGRIYFACTNGGMQRCGQIWSFNPAAGGGGGSLSLFIEPNDSSVICNADNITVSPSGDLFVCEDSEQDDQKLLCVSPRGEISPFARNALNASELAGAAFSPDGSTLFVNIQNPGLTLAIQGPWRHSP